MKKHASFLLFFVFALSFSQYKITVYEAGDRKPMPNATVSCNKVPIGKTNALGELDFRTKCKMVEVSKSGYYTEDILVDKRMEATLSEVDSQTRTIETVILNGKSDPEALKILDLVNANFDNNSPKKLDSYSFKSYEKISYDFDEDSIRIYNDYLTRRLDSLANAPKAKQTDEQKKDSLEWNNVSKMMGKSKMFLWEKAQEYLYSKKYGEKITILDNRISGLKEPIYEMFTLRSNRNKVPREVAKENRNLYRYFLSDSIEIDGRMNYVIRFRQVDYKQTINRRKYNGYLYIDKDTYAVKKLESASKKSNEGTITSIWKPIDNQWFLIKENFKLKAGNVAFGAKPTDSVNLKKKFGMYVFLTSDFFDFKVPADVQAKDFKGYTMEVRNTDGKTLDQYRINPLSEREEDTYKQIDSLGKKYKVDQKASVLSALVKGKVRVGNVDFDAAQFLKYNLYEGLRIGVGAKLNERFNRYISPDAYVGYGFKDKAFKYGVGVDVRTTTRKTSFFRAEYYDDVVASGKFSENMWNFRMKLMNSGVDMKNDVFYGYKGFKLSYETDIANSLTLQVAAKKDQERALFDYDYKGLGSEFDNFSTRISLKYSPQSKNIMTPSGKYTFEQNFPEVFFNYEKGMKTFGGDLEYDRFDVLLAHQLKWSGGVTGLRAYAGLMLGEAPIWHNFQQNGLGSGKPNSFNFNLTSYLGFATMEAGKYYNDRFAGFYLTHRIPWYFKSFGKNTSSFDVVYRGIIGDMKNMEDHQFQYDKLDHFYQEIGLEWNNFLSSQFNLGFFYRVGHYHTPAFKDNFAIQFKFKFLGF